jgi:hypothetical protein
VSSRGVGFLTLETHPGSSVYEKPSQWSPQVMVMGDRYETKLPVSVARAFDNNRYSNHSVYQWSQKNTLRKCLKPEKWVIHSEDDESVMGVLHLVISIETQISYFSRTSLLTDNLGIRRYTPFVLGPWALLAI